MLDRDQLCPTVALNRGFFPAGELGELFEVHAG
jgi:hypothetical protein